MKKWFLKYVYVNVMLIFFTYDVQEVPNHLNFNLVFKKNYFVFLSIT